MRKRTLDKGFTASIEALRGRPCGEVLDGLVTSLENDEPTVAIRINTRKADALPLRPVPWSLGGYYIDGERPRFTFDPALHQGLYYVQDPSSMVIGRIAGALSSAAFGGEPIIYIDACAAPGGKTTAAINALPDGSLVIANEFDRRRAEVLVENIVKWGYPDVVVTQGDTAKFAGLGPVADIVAADVPCSGEGMMRKEDAAIEQWSAGLVAQCAALQRTIINNMWKALRPGGFFIYSTCTFNHSENEENLAYIVEELGGIPQELRQMTGGCGQIAGAIDSPYPAARFIPGRTEGEGLFVAVVRKPLADTGGTPDTPKGKHKDVRTPKGKTAAKPSAVPPEIKSWTNADGYTLAVDGDRITALPESRLPLISDIRKKLNVIYAGTEVAVMKGREYIPSQALALSAIAAPGVFPEAEVDYATAMQYLGRQAVTLDDAPKGIVLLTYRHRPLGFVKNLGNRANNLYPQGWAIRSTHVPDNAPDLI